MSARKTSIILWILVLLFFLRVLGQLVVAIWAPSYLPAMEVWYSGLMPYRYLLPSQILILIVFVQIARDLSREHGYWYAPKRHVGIGLIIFGSIYFLSMIVRYFIQGFSIPVVFHWVLASYILVLGYYHVTRSVRSKI